MRYSVLIALVFTVMVAAGCLASEPVSVTIGMENGLGSNKAAYLCDGAADDLQWQEAIDFVTQNGGGTVYVLPGTYYPKKEIAMKPNVTLFMQPGAVLKLPDQFISQLTADYTGGNTITVSDASGFAAGMQIGVSTANTGYVQGSYTTVRSISGNTLTIDPALDKPFHQNDFCFSHYSLIAVRNNIDNVRIIGGELDGNRAGSLVHIVNADSMFNGIASYGDNDNLLIRNVYVHDMLFQGIHPWGPHPNLLIEGCRAENNDAGGIVIDTVNTYAVCRDNICNNNSTGLYSVNSYNVTIQGGEYNNNRLNGVEVGHPYGNQNVSISGVKCSGNGNGIWLGHLEGAVVSQVTLTNNRECGIKLATACSNVVIDGASISGSPTGISEHNSDQNYTLNCAYAGCQVNTHWTGENSRDLTESPQSAFRQAAFLSNACPLPASIRANAVPVTLRGNRVSNLLGDSGSIALHKAEYQRYGTYGCLNLWLDNMVKTVDGEACIDGYWSDFDWANQAYRANYLRVPGISGHKYALILKSKKYMFMEEIDSRTGTPLGRIERTTAGWEPLVYVTNGNGEDLLFFLRNGYVTPDAGYYRDLMVIDLTDSGDDGLPNDQIISKYGTLQYISTQNEVAAGPISFHFPVSQSGDLLRGAGNLEIHSQDYRLTGKYGCLSIWLDNMVRTVDGVQCLDGKFSDYQWPVTRANVLRLNSIADHKYVVVLKTKNTFSIEQADPATGAIIGRASANSADWTPMVLVASGTGQEMVFLLRSGYITDDQGYCRDIMAFDATARGDGGLTDEQLAAQYAALTFSSIVSQSTAVNLPCELRSIGPAADEISWNGILTRRIKQIELGGDQIESLSPGARADLVTTVACLPDALPQSDGIDHTIDMVGKYEAALADLDSPEGIGKFAAIQTPEGSRLVFAVTKGQFAALSDFQAFCQSNPLKVKYILRTPETASFPNYAALVTGGAGDVILVEGAAVGAVPEIILTCPENMAAQRQLNLEIDPYVTDKGMFLLEPGQVSEIAVSGDTSAAIPEVGSVSFGNTAGIKDQFGSPAPGETVRWSVMGQSRGVLIDSGSGIIALSDTAISGPIAVKAALQKDGRTAGIRTVQLMPAPLRQLQIEGMNEVVIPENGTTQWQYVATAVYGQLEAAACTWTLASAPFGTALDPHTGILSVASGTAPGSVTVAVYSAANAGAAASKTITIVPDREVPPVPTELTLTPSRTSVLLNWAAVSGALSYDVETDGTAVINVTGLSYRHDGLAPSQQHSYRIRARNAAGPGEWGPVKQGTTLPELPGLCKVAVTTTKTSAVLSWSPAANAARYQVEIDFKRLVTVQGLVFQHTGLKTGSTHAYRVRGVNASGQGQWSAPAIVKIKGKPAVRKPVLKR
ncbi:MAG: right-handed parallel beta-helix repeat-containing protein [Solirubrobacterales bacterium]